MFECLQRVEHFEMGKIDSNILLSSITSFGGDILNLPVGKIQKIFFADFIEISLTDSIDIDLNTAETIEIVNHIIFSGLDSSNIKHRFISGKLI